ILLARSIILLYVVLCLAADTGGSVASPSARQPYRLADFEEYGLGWRTYSEDAGSHMHYVLEAIPRSGGQGKVLRLEYRFTTAEATAAGFSIPLHGLDASGYDHLSFWLKGEPRQGYADALKVEFRRPDPTVRGMEEKGSYVVGGIGADWRHYLIPLNAMTGIHAWTGLKELVIVVQARRSPVRQGGFYLDDIQLLQTGQPGPSSQDKVVAVGKEALEASLGGREAMKPYLQARLVGWPSRVRVDRAELPADPQAFLWRLARDTWRGLTALSDREHGLPLDYVHLDPSTPAVTTARLGDYTNVSTVGLYLLSIVAALELGFIERSEALALLNITLGTLERLETYRGFFYNFYDTTTLERTSHFVSFVDSSWLTAGLMVTRMHFPELYGRCTRLIEQGDYGFFYDPVLQHMHQGYYVNLPAYSEYHYGLLYTESRLGSLIAIGKGDVPAEHWFRLIRTFPAGYDWQSLPPQNRRLKRVGSWEGVGGYYEWEGWRYVPSWGGSLFEALMPTLVLDEQLYAPASLGRNNAVHATLHRRYALEQLAYPVWGLSPSSNPEQGGYSEYGIKVLGVRGYPAGAVSPHAAALALAVLPEQATANLLELANRYELYGEYGFYDAVAPASGKVAYTYLALDQAMLFIALANHLCAQCIQHYFAADPIVRGILPLLGLEDFFD
ncbi:MAG TPA: glucoamylase family protein, partial [Candidatus Competibacteraceae bacterium]|nr:glucoamylase family protein [Candidatus Competibacteraceae bacterium]